jgi:hypothetical protein
MPTITERYRFVPFEIEDVNAIPQPLLGGYADVTRGGGMTFERVVFPGSGDTSRADFYLKKGARKAAGTVWCCLSGRSANQDMTDTPMANPRAGAHDHGVVNVSLDWAKPEPPPTSSPC